MRSALLILCVLAAPAMATDKKIPTPVPLPTPPGQYQTQYDSATATATSAASQGQYTVTDNRSAALALGNGAPPPPVCPAGLVPGKHGKRGLYVGFVGLSSLCTAPDASQAEAMQKAHADEVELIKLRIEAARAQAEADREATARIQAQSCRDACQRK